MSSSLSTCEVLLSKQLADYWAGTTTGAGSSTTIVDTALKAKANNWITPDAYDHITSATCLDEERKISSLVNTTGTLTVLAHTGTGPGTAATYRIHRLFSASDKRIALISAAKSIFPHCFKQVRDENATADNWLLNGGMENWALTTVPDNWYRTAVTCTQVSTNTCVRRGTYSCSLSVAAGNIRQSLPENAKLAQLVGESVTYSAEAMCDTASCCRLGITDAAGTTYSDYHTGGSLWEKLSMTYTVSSDPYIGYPRFTIYYLVNTASCYIDDARVTGPAVDRVYIGDLGLAQNKPHGVFQSSDDYIYTEPWARLRNYEVDSGGYLYCPEATADYRLRIEGIGYLDFLASGVSSTAWTATIAIDSPQTEILVAEAACFLYRQMIMPNYTAGDNKDFANALVYWERELARRKALFGMMPPKGTIHYGYRG